MGEGRRENWLRAHGWGGEEGIVPHCRGTWAEVEEPRFRKAADVGGNVCFICTGVHAHAGRVEGGEKAESLL